ncbi:MAG: ribosome maturation factor RimM [Bdellovibrionales bacterium]
MTKAHQKIGIAKFLGPHGVRGQMKLAPFTQDPESVFDYAPLTDETGERTFTLDFRGTGSDHYIVSVEGVTTRDQAEKLKGATLYVDRADLPPEEEGEYYFADLIGLRAQDAAGKEIGNVTDVHDYGAGVFLEIKPANAKSFMLPFKDAFVPTVDLEKSLIEVIIPEGWLSEEKPPKPKKETKECPSNK